MSAAVLGAWRKSTRSSGAQACVEIGGAPGVRGVRDSKSGASSPVLRFGEAAFTSFLDRVKSGDLDH